VSTKKTLKSDVFKTKMDLYYLYQKKRINFPKNQDIFPLLFNE
jgi:hypothetical protein